MDFRNNGIGIMGITALCGALKSNEVLATLILGSNSVGDEGAELLSRYMAGAPPCGLLIDLLKCDNKIKLLNECVQSWSSNGIPDRDSQRSVIYGGIMV